MILLWLVGRHLQFSSSLWDYWPPDSIRSKAQVSPTVYDLLLSAGMILICNTPFENRQPAWCCIAAHTLIDSVVMMMQDPPRSQVSTCLHNPSSVCWQAVSAYPFIRKSKIISISRQHSQSWDAFERASNFLARKKSSSLLALLERDQLTRMVSGSEHAQLHCEHEKLGYPTLAQKRRLGFHRVVCVFSESRRTQWWPSAVLTSLWVWELMRPSHCSSRENWALISILC